VYPVEVLGDGPCLVGLDGPDEVPGQAQILQFRHFLQGFLQVTLAKFEQAAAVSRADVRGWSGFAYGEHQYVTVSALAFFCAESYSLEQLCYIVAKQLLIHGANGSRFVAWEATQE
jgi:hypothetical protein